MHHSNKEHKYMKEHEDTYVAVLEKHTLDGANRFTLMKHKHKEHEHEWRHHDYYNVVLRWLLSTPICKMHREWEATKYKGSFRLPTSLGEATYSVKGTVQSSK